MSTVLMIQTKRDQDLEGFFSRLRYHSIPFLMVSTIALQEGKSRKMGYFHYSWAYVRVKDRDVSLVKLMNDQWTIRDGDDWHQGLSKPYRNVRENYFR